MGTFHSSFAAVAFHSTASTRIPSNLPTTASRTNETARGPATGSRLRIQATSRWKNISSGPWGPTAREVLKRTTSPPYWKGHIDKFLTKSAGDAWQGLTPVTAPCCRFDRSVATGLPQADRYPRSGFRGRTRSSNRIRTSMILRPPEAANPLTGQSICGFSLWYECRLAGRYRSLCSPPAVPRRGRPAVTRPG